MGHRFFRRSIFVLMLASILIAALNFNWTVTALAVAVSCGAVFLLVKWDTSEWERIYGEL